MSVPVHYFQKRCPHGRPMRLLERFSGARYWQVEECAACEAAEEAKRDDAEREADAFIERLAAKKRRDT